MCSQARGSANKLLKHKGSLVQKTLRNTALQHFAPREGEVGACGGTVYRGLKDILFTVLRIINIEDKA